MRTSRTAVIVMLAAELGACTSWGPPRAGGVEPQARRLQVWQSGQAVELDRATVSNDSIVGLRAGRGEPARGVRIAMARASVDSVRVRRTSKGKTVLVGIGALAAVAGVVVGVAMSSLDYGEIGNGIFPRGLAFTVGH